MTNSPEQPRLVPTGSLESYFAARNIAFSRQTPLRLGFGEGRDQYCFYPYPAPADDETMGIFCEWHTADYFDVDSGPHVAIGMRGPRETDPHRGRGLAIGILANQAINPEQPDQPVALFRGCPDPPGGPAFFIEDFTGNDGRSPISAWQLSEGQGLPALQGSGVYRLDIHVSRDRVWAGVWQLVSDRSVDVPADRRYVFLGQTVSTVSERGAEHPADRGQGNAFIGTGFSDPNTRSRVENIFIAHWKNPA